MSRISRVESAVLGIVLAAVFVACSDNENAGLAAGPAEEARPAEAVVADIEAAIPQLLADARIAGLSICWMRGFEIEWCGAFGVTDADTRTPVQTTTVFQAASLSKPVFAYIVLQLADRGVIDLDTPLLEYVDLETARAGHLGESFDDPRVGEVTARLVMTHTSGFPNWRRNGNLGFLFDPGERFGYSGEGFGLLQMVVEQITGSSLEELAEELVFQPLGMTNSTYAHAVLDLENYAWPHDGSGALEPKPENLDERFARARPHAAATLMTTAPDYARFLVAFSKGAALDDARRAELLKPYVDVNDAGSVAWGLGTGLEIAGDSVSAWHWGDNGNSKAFYLVDTEQGDGLVYFANAWNGLGVVGDLVGLAVPADHPVLESDLMNTYPPHDSPEFRFWSAVYEGGAEGAAQFVRELQLEGNRAPVSERVVNEVGYWLVRQKRLDEALGVFELNVELYPEAWNAYDSLAEAHMMLGRDDEAIRLYRRSLELNPDNSNAADMIARITQEKQ
jgi:CubicO group peptidase (beta-lactamase class C family)